MIIFISISRNSLAQENKVSVTANSELKIIGIIDNGSEKYFVTELGAIKLDEEDPYRDYYRAIYEDSTLINPNTELKGNYSMNFFPVTSINGYENFYKNLNSEYYLSDFLNIDSLGNYTFKPGYLWIFSEQPNQK